MVYVPIQPQPPHRRSIRLRGYDYSQSGAYYVTICTQQRFQLFGEIINGQTKLNDPGWMVVKWWEALPRKFPVIEMDQYIVMPNHFHGLVIVVGAARCGRPIKDFGHPHGGAPTLGDVMDWFKTMTTNEYIRGVKQRNWKPFPSRLWQRNYYEHVIRDENELQEIREYIINNPAQWAEDEYYTKDEKLIKQASHEQQ